MRIRKMVVIPAVCVAALVTFGQGAANVGKSVEELKKEIDLGALNVSEFRDKQNKKFTKIKTTSFQDKDMGFEGVMRVTLELKGDNGDVWYGQLLKPQAKASKLTDYTGEDTWEFQTAHGLLKYPELSCVVEYGYQMTNKTFVAIDSAYKKDENAADIMTRNKDSKNKLTITAKTRAEREGQAGGGGGE